VDFNTKIKFDPFSDEIFAVVAIFSCGVQICTAVCMVICVVRAAVYIYVCMTMY
jgi:hypothetical protein